MIATRVIDVWANPADTELLDNVPEVKKLMVKSKSPIASVPKNYKMSPEDTASMAKQSGVDIVFMSAWSRPKTMCITNENVAEYVKACPETFKGLGAVDLAKPMKAVAEVDKCIKEYKFKGIRILPWLWNLPPNTNVYYPIYAKCVELDVPICMQVKNQNLSLY